MLNASARTEVKFLNYFLRFFRAQIQRKIESLADGIRILFNYVGATIYNYIDNLSMRINGINAFYLCTRASLFPVI